MAAALLTSVATAQKQNKVKQNQINGDQHGRYEGKCRGSSVIYFGVKEHFVILQAH